MATAKRNQVPSSAVTRLLVTLLFTVVPVFSQTQSKVIEWSKKPVGSNNETAAPGLRLFRQIDGVEIEDIVVDGKSIIVGEPFAAGDDWLKSFTVRVRNVSGQRVVKVQVTLVLPEMNQQSPDVVFCYGCTAEEKEKGVTPGEVVELKMPGGDFYDSVKKRIAEKGSVSRITKAEIHSMFVMLPSGPTWFSGCVKTTNPKNGCPPSVVQGYKQEALAQDAAEAWLRLWDAGKYKESYADAAEATRAVYTARMWYVYWYAARKPLGEVISRKQISAQYNKSQQGMPGREGVSLQYESSFVNRESVVESFILLLEKNGAWRVYLYINNLPTSRE